MMRRDGSLPDTAPRWQLLTLACLLAGLVAGCGSPMAAEQKEAFVEFQAMGGRVNYEHGGYQVDLRKTQGADGDLVHLQKISKLTAIDLRDTLITDVGLEHLRSIETLKFVGLPRAGVTAEGAESLRKSLPNAQVQH